MGGAQMGTIFDTDLRNFNYTDLCHQDIRDMQSASPEQMGRLISQTLQLGNHYLGFVAIGVLASSAVEPVPFEVKKGVWGRERTIYEQDALRLQARRQEVLGEYLSHFAKVDFDAESSDVVVEATLDCGPYGMRNY